MTPRTEAFKIKLGGHRATPHQILRRIRLNTSNSKIFTPETDFSTRLSRCICLGCKIHYGFHPNDDHCSKKPPYYFTGDEDFYKLCVEIKLFALRARLHGVKIF